MNARNLTAILALASAVAFTAPASAVSTGNVFQDVKSATSGSGQIRVNVNGNTATLFGYSDKTDAKAAERAALAAPGIDRVINRIDSNS